MQTLEQKRIERLNNRVKLTKEDFKNEGWLVLDNVDGGGTNEPYWEIHCMGKLCDLYYRSDIGRMQITTKGGHISIFHGSCYSIEDLRTICLLVNFARPYYDKN